MPDATKAVIFTKDDLAQKYGQRGKNLSGNTVRQTMSACGLDTSKREYTADEEEKFKLARKMIEDHKTYRDVAAHFKVNLKDAGSGNGDAFFENQATEASDSGDVSFELANAIATNQATQVAEMVPALTMYHLNNLMSGGAVHTKLQGLVTRIQGMRGNAHEIMMQGIQRLEEQKQLALSDGSATKQLASANGSTSKTATTPTATQAKQLTSGNGMKETKPPEKSVVTETKSPAPTSTGTTSTQKSSATSTASSVAKSSDSAKK